MSRFNISQMIQNGGRPLRDPSERTTARSRSLWNRSKGTTSLRPTRASPLAHSSFSRLSTSKNPGCPAIADPPHPRSHKRAIRLQKQPVFSSPPAASGAAGIGEHTQDALVVIHKGGGLAKIGTSPDQLSTQSRSPPSPVSCTMRRERPVTSATRSVPKRCRIWSSAPASCGKDAKMLDHAVAPFDGLARNHRIAGGVVCRAREEVPLIVAVEFKQLGRERVAEIVRAKLARRDVDRKIDPFRSGPRPGGDRAAPRWSKPLAASTA